ANRLIQQGAFKIEGAKISPAKIIYAKGTNNVFQVGKRKFAKIIIK
ncbi:tyrosine--tRNA ligase, partial [Francisella tularensis subsp. holarctica]|nr:tyrosine--tRNA ligase [Francisella tularensis subsp. holarctica]